LPCIHCKDTNDIHSPTNKYFLLFNNYGAFATWLLDPRICDSAWSFRNANSLEPQLDARDLLELVTYFWISILGENKGLKCQEPTHPSRLIAWKLIVSARQAEIAFLALFDWENQIVLWNLNLIVAWKSKLESSILKIKDLLTSKLLLWVLKTNLFRSFFGVHHNRKREIRVIKACMFSKQWYFYFLQLQKVF